MSRVAMLALAGALLAGCAQAPETVPYQMGPTDLRFYQAVHTNTETFAGLNPADVALYGHQVCIWLRSGGVVAQAAAHLPGDSTVRGNLDKLYLASTAAQDYCPNLPTKKPEPHA